MSALADPVGDIVGQVLVKSLVNIIVVQAETKTSLVNICLTTFPMILYLMVWNGRNLVTSLMLLLTVQTILSQGGNLSRCF